MPRPGQLGTPIGYGSGTRTYLSASLGRYEHYNLKGDIDITQSVDHWNRAVDHYCRWGDF